MKSRPTAFPTVLFFLLAAALSACSVAPPGSDINDPYEAANRQRFETNQSVDRAIVRPLAMGYGEAVPDRVRTSVSNFADNLDTPRYFVNDVLQGEGEDAVHNLFRFVINTTIGLGGLFDPASSFGLTPRSADFGQTLHAWGASEGAYLVVPVLGPSTERDLVGTVVDLAMNPIRFVLPANRTWIDPASGVASGLDTRYRLRATIDGVLYESADSYAQSRSIYLQNRRFELGGDDESYFDPYDDPYGQ